MTQWMAADKAFAHVLSLELVPDVAHKKLTERIGKGEIPGRAASLSSKQGGDEADAIVPSDFWDTRGRIASLTIDFQAGIAVRNDFSPVQGANTPIKPYLVRRATGLSFSTRHLFQCFPGEQEAPADRRGRPLDTGFESADEQLVEQMRTILEERRAASPTQAAWIVIGRDGTGALGNGTPESKKSRLVKRYKDRYGE